MAGLESDTIGGYNSYIDKMKNTKAKVTTVLFDNQYELLTNRVDISKIKKLDNKTYYVRGGTALYDAIGKTITTIERQTKNKVLFVITTDGLENSSIEYNKKSISKLIKKHNDWEFLYIGANIDSYAEGAALGISRKNIANYEKSGVGTTKLFSSIERASSMIMNEKCLDTSWKKDLN
jgi:hypothetical protein